MMNQKYDYLIVGSGLFGASFAHFAHKQGKRCLVIDKRSHLGGNIYCVRTSKVSTCISMALTSSIPPIRRCGTL